MSTVIEQLSAFDPLAAPGGGSSTRPPLRYVLLDVFTDAALEGNQLAVFTDGRGLSGAEMQRLARELNLSESVFVLEPEDGSDLRIRIFTPGSELPFAGHPVLGSAILAGSALGLEQLTLQTGRGSIPVRLEPGGGRVRSGWMQQPIPTWAPFARPEELLAALGVERSSLPIEVYDNGPRHVYVELAHEDAVAALRPDMRALSELGAVEANCFAGAGGHWKTRMFAPALGVPEDPATGSAAGPLAVHLCRHGRVAFGAGIEIRQGAEIGRPSLLLARAEGELERIDLVEVGGSAVMLARGVFDF